MEEQILSILRTTCNVWRVKDIGSVGLVIRKQEGEEPWLASVNAQNLRREAGGKSISTALQELQAIMAIIR